MEETDKVPEDKKEAVRDRMPQKGVNIDVAETKQDLTIEEGKVPMPRTATMADQRRAGAGAASGLQNANLTDRLDRESAMLQARLGKITRVQVALDRNPELKDILNTIHELGL